MAINGRVRGTDGHGGREEAMKGSGTGEFRRGRELVRTGRCMG